MNRRQFLASGAGGAAIALGGCIDTLDGGSSGENGGDSEAVEREIVLVDVDGDPEGAPFEFEVEISEPTLSEISIPLLELTIRNDGDEARGLDNGGRNHVGPHSSTPGGLWVLMENEREYLLTEAVDGDGIDHEHPSVYEVDTTGCITSEGAVRNDVYEIHGFESGQESTTRLGLVGRDAAEADCPATGEYEFHTNYAVEDEKGRETDTEFSWGFTVELR